MNKEDLTLEESLKSFIEYTKDLLNTAIFVRLPPELGHDKQNIYAKVEQIKKELPKHGYKLGRVDIHESKRDLFKNTTQYHAIIFIEPLDVNYPF